MVSPPTKPLQYSTRKDSGKRKKSGQLFRTFSSFIQILFGYFNDKTDFLWYIAAVIPMAGFSAFHSADRVLDPGASEAKAEHMALPDIAVMIGIGKNDRACPEQERQYGKFL
jgi:hypothetical protein